MCSFSCGDRCFEATLVIERITKYHFQLGILGRKNDKLTIQTCQLNVEVYKQVPLQHVIAEMEIINY